MPTQPQLGYGQKNEYAIDQVNRWMRSQPWWSQIRGSNTGDLTPDQRRQILRAAQAQGVVVDEGDMEIDKGGNFNPKGHKLRNTLIVAGLAGATLATMGAAGAFSAGALPATATVPTAGTLPAGLASGTSMAGLTGAAGATGAATGAGVLGTAGAVAPLASTQIGTGAIGPIAGGTGMATRGVPWGRIFDAAGAFGTAASDFADARRDERNQAGLNTYRENLANEARFRSQLQARQLALQAPQLRADNSIRGDRLANAQDLNIELPSNIPKLNITGGFKPSMWSENTRQLGRQMSADALAGSGTDELAPPPVERAPEANDLDSVLNTASLFSAIPYFRKRRQ